MWIVEEEGKWKRNVRKRKGKKVKGKGKRNVRKGRGQRNIRGKSKGERNNERREEEIGEEVD